MGTSKRSNNDAIPTKKSAETTMSPATESQESNKVKRMHQAIVINYY